MRLIFGILFIPFILMPCFAAQPVKPKDTVSQTSSKAVKSSNTKSSKPAKVVTKSQKKPSLRTEAEFSGFSSDVSDQLYGRINITGINTGKKWWIKAGHGFTQSRTYNKDKINKTNVFTYNLDTEYRRDGKNGYSFVSSLINTKYPSVYKNIHDDVSGYYMLSAGHGKTLSPGVECEAALAYITVHKDTIERHIGIVYALRLKTPLSSSTTLDSDMHFVDPLTNNGFVDSRVNLTYKLTQALSMRLTYTVNNILGTALYRSDWDKSARVMLVFSRGR